MEKYHEHRLYYELSYFKYTVKYIFNDGHENTHVHRLYPSTFPNPFDDVHKLKNVLEQTKGTQPFEYITEEILSHPENGMENPFLREYFEKDIQDAIKLTTAGIKIDYTEFDFDGDGKNDYFVAIHSPIHGGNAGVQLLILLTDENDYREISLPTMRIYHDSENWNWYSDISVLKSKSNGLHDILIKNYPSSEKNLILKYDYNKYIPK